jgi:hypothetical protein
MTNPTRLIKCRYCNYTVPPFYRTRSGVPVSGFRRLAEHIEDAHPEAKREADQRRRCQAANR